MIAYREQRRRVRTRDALARVEAARGFERLMELGELEAGVADALCPDRDIDLPVLRALRRGEWRGLSLPEEIEISVPEGFAYYALDPELYRRAARRFESECRPERIAVIGIRSIGTTLATEVADALQCETESWTVRPRGHPWNRELRVEEALASRWREWPGWFAVVDEGPGLSGSSFASVSRFLEGLGIDASRIVLLPSWVPDGSAFVNDAARRAWGRYRKYAAAFEELDLFAHARDLSGGTWRGPRDIAVQPQHERRKYLRGGTLYKFAGYGRYGRQKLARAERLAGWVPQPLGLDNGFLSMRWLPAAAEPPAIATLARYLAHIRRTFPTGAAPQFEPLAGMIAVNTGFDASEFRSIVQDGAEVLLDGRMFPHEWIGECKTDALDHGDDHFLPGPQDIAWDLAGTAVEFGFGRAVEEEFLDSFARFSGDRDAAARVPFYRLAYLAFRIGYCGLAVQALGDSEDGRRFVREKERYRRLLEESKYRVAHGAVHV